MTQARGSENQNGIGHRARPRGVRIQKGRSRLGRASFWKWVVALWLGAAGMGRDGKAAPQLLDDQFELPAGFHIYRAAERELTGGSYAITLDGNGRVLVGDGTALRRLSDTNGDGMLDHAEVIATGLGGRGPQGILVYGDNLYAVGGDGVQRYQGYPDKLVSMGRIGARFRTGGDHDAHTLMRGHDGWIYLVAGNGAGIEGRTHITETNSPVIFEREASVFRFDPQGAHWECVSTGGRNPPSLGMNYLGDLFSFDSDMEWHVGLPWYRPVRLNHWAIGGDQGWKEVGALRSYDIDNLSGILNVGRGSPTWGRFYEHQQFPEKYRDAFLVCDYRWKAASNDRYATTGRLLAFFLSRAGAEWKAEYEVLAKPREGARDANGKAIDFSLVDCEVAPDGSLFISEHNQGIWRLFYDGKAVADRVPDFVPKQEPLPSDGAAKVRLLLTLPQPGAEWSRRWEASIRQALGSGAGPALEQVALNPEEGTRMRLRAVRLLAPGFASMSDAFLRSLARQSAPEIRGQAAWLVGLRARKEEVRLVLRLYGDEDAFVRRKAAEALTRFADPAALPALMVHLGDPSRWIRYISMVALAHQRPEGWLSSALSKTDPEVRMRALVAVRLRGEEVPAPLARSALMSLMRQVSEHDGREERLDLLRVMALFQGAIEQDNDGRAAAEQYVLESFPDPDIEVRWEQVRLLGLFRVGKGFKPLLELLGREEDHVTQFHIAEALARLKNGWDSAGELELARWVAARQEGWFAEFADKGVEFPQFWETVLQYMVERHRGVFETHRSLVRWNSLLGVAMLNVMIRDRDAAAEVVALFRAEKNLEAQKNMVRAMRRVHDPAVRELLREEASRGDGEIRKEALESLAAQTLESADVRLLAEGIAGPDNEVARVCAEALAKLDIPLNEEVAKPLVQRLSGAGPFRALESALVQLSGEKRPGFRMGESRGPEAGEQLRAVEFWKSWYRKEFGHAFQSAGVKGKSDEELRRFLLGPEKNGGDWKRGAAVYDKLQCNACHGGGVYPGREGKIFGPDLAGVTRRLNAEEFADALVYPSKQVAERYKATEIELQDGEVLTGFVTGETAVAVTLADRDGAHTIERSRIRRLAPQAGSLMPDHLLAEVEWVEIRDLVAFLDQLGRR